MYSIEALHAGDENAFKAFYELHYAQLYGFVLKHTDDQQLAEDLVQQAFIKLWQKRTSIYSALAFKSYLFTTARNLVIDEYHRKLAEQEAQLVFKDLLQTTPSEEVHQTILQEINAAIEALPPKRRRIFEMHKLEGLSHREIAAALSISISTVEKQMVAAMKTLREKLSHLAYCILF